MKKITIIFLILFLFLAFTFLFNDSYQLKIEIKLQNVNPDDLDKNYAKNIEKDILNLSGIDDVVIFSSKYGINIYCKFDYFANKNELINKIQRTLSLYNFEDVYFNEKYYLKYDCFIIVNSENNNYYSLENKADLIFDEILKLKIARDVKIFGLQDKVINIYFKDSDLIKFDLNISDIKEVIRNNNHKYNFIENGYSKNIDVNLKSIEDVKNILFNFKNSNFSLKFEDVFDIKQEIKTPIEKNIFYGDKNALVIVISFKKFYPLWLLKRKLSNFDIKIIKPSNMKKSEIYLGDNSSYDLLFKTYQKIQKEEKKDNLYFLALEAPKTNNIETFDEIKNNRIIIFSNRFKHKSENKIFAPEIASGIEYKIDKNKLNEYYLLNKDAFNLIAQNSSGIFCDYFYDEDEKIEIYLKNDSNFIYSKKFKNLISKDEILKTEFKNNYILIARNKLKRVKIIKNQKPF